MRILIHDDYQALSRWTAHFIADKINRAAVAGGRPFVLGLPAGATPVGTYEVLAALCREGKVSFRNVVTFNTSEFAGLDANHPFSSHSFMREHLFRHLDIPAASVHILDGQAADPEAECERYEARIAACGGIDLFLGGVGTDGNIAFNEPGSSLTSRTRAKALTLDARQSVARFFGNDPARVPRQVLTVGVGTIMDSRQVVMILSGASKARALQKVVEEGMNHMWTVSMLQTHRHGIVACDDDATLELKVGTVRYFKEIEREKAGRAGA